jgi:hypothetical protein
VHVALYTPNGRRVARPAVRRFGAGTHAVGLPAGGVASRLLLVRVSGEDFQFAGLVRNR